MLSKVAYGCRSWPPARGRVLACGPDGTLGADNRLARQLGELPPGWSIIALAALRVTSVRV